MITIVCLLFSTYIFPSTLAFYLDVYLTPLDSDPNDFVFKRIDIDKIEDIDNIVDKFCEYNNVNPSFCSDIKVQAIKSAHIYAPFKPCVNSFDIFDTILARDVLHPNDIFSLVEDGFPYRNFKFWREQAGNMADGTFNDIYSHFGRLSGEENSGVIEALKRFEIACELNHTYLMEQNYRLVKDGDILVTDMYLPFDVIANLLKHAGYNKTTNLYVSSFGKSHGWMFRQLLGMYIIRKHVGDNLHSDVQQAGKYGISSELSELHLLSPVEQTLASAAPVSGTALALLLRRFRHRNPHPHGSAESALFLDQAQYNIPLLLFISYEIREIMRREGLTRLLLTTRQGCLLEKLFPKLFPTAGIETLRLASSRRALRHPSTAYKEYLKAVYLPGQTLIFDLYGTFKSGLALFRSLFRSDPRVHMFVHRNASAQEKVEYFNGLTFTFHTDSLHHLEDLNVDLVGPLINVYTDDAGQLREFRAPIGTYTVQEARVYHDAVALFLATVDCSMVAALLHSISLEAVASGVDEVCGSGGRQVLSPLTPALLVSDTVREILLRIAPCPSQVRRVVSDHVHSSLPDWIAEFSWPWGRDVSPEQLEWELQPWFDRPAQLLFIDRAAAAGGGGRGGDVTLEDIASSSAKYAVFALYLGRRFASVSMVYQSSPPRDGGPTASPPAPPQRPPGQKSYSLFRFHTQDGGEGEGKGEGEDSYSHFLDIQEVAHELDPQRFDFIFESNIPCLVSESDGDGSGDQDQSPRPSDEAPQPASSSSTILELLAQQIAALPGRHPRGEQGDLFPPLRTSDGDGDGSGDGWLLALHFDLRLCGGNSSHLQSHYSRRLRRRLDSAAPLVYITYWIGNVLVFRAAPK